MAVPSPTIESAMRVPDPMLTPRPISVAPRSITPGSRIVSHRFLLGDWKPERTETVRVGGVSYLIHLWTVKGKPGSPWGTR